MGATFYLEPVVTMDLGVFVLFKDNTSLLPFTEKVKCVIELQRRLQPIYAQRGIIIKPWKSWN